MTNRDHADMRIGQRFIRVYRGRGSKSVNYRVVAITDRRIIAVAENNSHVMEGDGYTLWRDTLARDIDLGQIKIIED